MIAFELNSTTIKITDQNFANTYTQGTVQLFWLGENLTVKNLAGTMLHRSNVREVSMPQYSSYVELQSDLTAIFLTANVVFDNRNADGTTAAAGSAGVIGWLSMIWDKIADTVLPAGASTEAKQDAIITELKLKADLSETQPVSVQALPLPSGAATQATLAALLTELQLKADLSETQPISAASLPLPSGAATAANQTNGNQIVRILGGATATGAATTLVATVVNTAFLIVAANANRKGLILQNASNKIVLVGIGFTPTAALFTYSLATNAVLEVPFQFAPNIINGIWTSGGAATGQINVTQAI